MQLVLAARDGDIATVRRVLADGCMNVNATDEVSVIIAVLAGSDAVLRPLMLLLSDAVLRP